jgi:hypothetical protein
MIDLNRDGAPVADVAAIDVRADAGSETAAPRVDAAAADALMVPPEPAPDVGGPSDVIAIVEPRPDAGPDSAKDVAPDLPPAPAVSVNKAAYTVGEAIAVSFANGPGNYADWIGIYDQNVGTPSDAVRSLLWYYTDNKGWDSRGSGSGPKNGTVTFSTGSKGSLTWPLPAGRYKALFQSDPYIQLAGPANFEVR